MKLWRVVMPLHRPLEHFPFNYSKLIAGGNASLFHIDGQNHTKSAVTVLEKIRPHVEPLRQINSPRDFLTYISWMAGNRMLPVRMDFGINHFLLGNVLEARRIFRQMDVDLNEYKQSIQDQQRPCLRLVVDLLEHDSAGLHALVRSWRDQNIEKLGLSASVAAPSLHLVPGP